MKGHEFISLEESRDEVKKLLEIDEKFENLSENLISVRAIALFTVLSVLAFQPKKAEAAEESSSPVLRGSASDLSEKQMVTVRRGVDIPSFNYGYGVDYTTPGEGAYFSESVYQIGFSQFTNKISNETIDLVDISGLPASNAVFLRLVLPYPYSLIKLNRVDQSSNNVFLVNFDLKTAKNISLDNSVLKPLIFLSDSKILLENTAQERYVFDKNSGDFIFLGQNAMEAQVSAYKSELSNKVGPNIAFNGSHISSNGIYYTYLIDEEGPNIGDDVTLKVFYNPEVEQSEMDLDMGLDMEVSDMGDEEMGGVDMSYDMAVEGTDDMGIIVDMARLDMGNSNNDMSVSVDDDLGLEDMRSGVVKTKESKGDGCNVVNPTAPMHKTPGGLTLLFASALTVAAGFRKKGKKSE